MTDQAAIKIRPGVYLDRSGHTAVVTSKDGLADFPFVGWDSDGADSSWREDGSWSFTPNDPHRLDLVERLDD